MTDERDGSSPDEARVTRRTLLHRGGSGQVVVVGSRWFTVGGGGSQSGDETTSGASGSPATGHEARCGATVRLGGSRCGDGNTLDGRHPLRNTDFARAYALFDPLTQVHARGVVHPVSAKSIEPNDGGTQWTTRLHLNVKTYDGEPIEAADLMSRCSGTRETGIRA